MPRRPKVANSVGARREPDAGLQEVLGRPKSCSRRSLKTLRLSLCSTTFAIRGLTNTRIARDHSLTHLGQRRDHRARTGEPGEAAEGRRASHVTVHCTRPDTCSPGTTAASATRSTPVSAKATAVKEARPRATAIRVKVTSLGEGTPRTTSPKGGARGYRANRGSRRARFSGCGLYRAKRSGLVASGHRFHG